MASRLPTALLVSLLISSLSFTTILLAQEQSVPEVENAKQQFEGRINSNAVYVRSGPGENYYPTLKLDRGASIKVVGIRYDWLKVIPPEGSFSYVAKAYVEKRGDGSVGRVTRNDLNVRAGSSLNQMKTSVQSRLNENDDVQIVGEQDEYFKIVPPKDAYLYVNKRYVDPVKPLTNDAAQQDESKAHVVENSAQEPQAQSSIAPPTGDVPDDSASSSAAAAAPTGDAEAPMAANSGNGDAAPAPTTQQSAAGLSPDQQFDLLEKQFAEASAQPIEEQPIDALLSDYQTLIANDQLPESMRRIADHRVSTLKVRAEARENFLAVKKIQDEMQQRQLALQAEKEELEQRIKQNEVKLYTAVGALNTSSLQQGRETLYRLTDPANGRTVVYIRSNDPKYPAMLGQFVGVKGELINDEQLKLKVITPTAIEAVDPSKINHGVVAQVVPPSLLPRAQATTEAPSDAAVAE